MAIDAHRIFHVNVNCSDLEQALRFYRDGIGLVTGTRTTPPHPQPGAAFGLPQVQWDAWIMHGAKGNKGVVLDLLEWQVPRPQGTPRRRVTDIGFNRLSIAVPDLDATHARLTDLGFECWTDPYDLSLGGTATRMFIASDPDGTQVELVEGNEVRLSHIAINTSDIVNSTRFYETVMGLRTVVDFGPATQTGVPFRLKGDVKFHAKLLRDMATGFMVELIQWIDPAPTSWGFRSANDLGIFRMAWLTHDIEQAYQMLVRVGVCCYTPPAKLAMGPGLPELKALFFDDPDAVCLELIEAGR